MGKIQRIHLKNMRNGVHYQFMDDVLRMAAGNGTVTGTCAARIAELKESFGKEGKCINVSTHSKLTARIRLADKERGRMYANFRAMVKAYAGMPIEDMSAAADVLWRRLKETGINPHSSMQQESGLITSLVDELEGRLEPYITRLDLGSMVSGMKEANESVKSLLLERSREAAGHEKGALKDARGATDKAYRSFIEMVEAYSVISADRGYDDFIRQANGIVTRYKRYAMGQCGNTKDACPDGGEEMVGSGPCADADGEPAGRQ